MIAPRLVLAPLALFLIGATAPAGVPREAGRGLVAEPADSGIAQPEPWRQVRIMQRFSIRITPGAPMPQQLQMELDQEDASPRFEERKIGKCLAVASIGAVQSGAGNRLLLFMRDQRIVSASLEKACRASEYYSGFYIQHNSDGQLCVDRDILQSRSGTSCKVKRWKELVEVADRRFP